MKKNINLVYLSLIIIDHTILYIINDGPTCFLALTLNHYTIFVNLFLFINKIRGHFTTATSNIIVIYKILQIFKVQQTQ